MIKVIDGNLFETDCYFIAHQVNCQGKMNSGVAEQIKTTYPKVYERYIDFVNESKEPLLGKNQSVFVLDADKVVVNMFSQDNYGYDGAQYTDYDALEKCFNKLKETIIFFDKKVAMPYRIGCCRGGANWSIVYNMIDRIFYDCEVELWRLNNEL